MTNLLLILTGVLLNAAAQLVLKKGMSQIGSIQVDINSILTMVLKASTNIYVWSGLIFYVISFVVWLMVLSRVEVSYAYFKHRLYHSCFCGLFLFWRVNDFE